MMNETFPNDAHEKSKAVNMAYTYTVRRLIGCTLYCSSKCKARKT